MNTGRYPTPRDPLPTFRKLFKLFVMREERDRLRAILYLMMILSFILMLLTLFLADWTRFRGWDNSVSFSAFLCFVVNLSALLFTHRDFRWPSLKDEDENENDAVVADDVPHAYVDPDPLESRRGSQGYGVGR